MVTTEHPYVIIGGGVAADKAARAIREREADADIVIYSESRYGPVYRPALSKDLWLGDSPEVASQELGTSEVATVRTGVTVTDLDTDARTVTLDSGETAGYGKLLLATGASPANFFDEVEGAVLFRTAEDYDALRAAVSEGTRVVIVGGGYIAAEMSAALTAVGADVTVYFPGARLLERLFPPKLLDVIEARYRDKGVTLVPGAFATEVAPGPRLTFRDGQTATADLVLLALGARLNTGLAEKAGLAMVGGAVEVDDHMRTSAVDVFAAGDIANYPDVRLGRRHVEHVDMAERSGSVAGANMAGGDQVYDYTPIFWSDMFDLGYEAVGELNSSLSMREFYNEDGSSAVVWYLDGEENVRGALLWNTWGKTSVARGLLGAPAPANLAEVIKPGE